MRQLILHPEAQEEFESARDRYDAERPGLGRDFVIEVSRVLDQIRLYPKQGSPYRGKRYRFRLTDRFPYVIYYTEIGDTIWVPAIAHGSRRPGYWRKRKPE